MSTAAAVIVPATVPMTRRVRAYFAPVNRGSGSPTIFDPSLGASFLPDTPPAPWIDLGWVRSFNRKSSAKVQAIVTGSPSGAQCQAREQIGASVSFQFEQWTKLTMGLAAGAQHMNVLAPGASAQGGNGSGSKAGAATALMGVGSLPNFLQLNGADLPKFQTGEMVAVDSDYAGQNGYVGAGVSAAYVKSAASVQSDIDYIRRVTFNVGRVSAVTPTGLQLAAPLIAGAPAAGMKVQQVLAFVDREGGSFFQEWSALFVMQGEQGDQVIYHYPRLQSSAGTGETSVPLQAPLAQVLLDASFSALPVIDSNDGERVYCFRTYVPASNAAI